MKTILIAVAILLSITAPAQIKSATLEASGLTCSMCSKSIYKALMKVPFVSAVSVDVEQSVYRITFKAGSKVVPDDIKKSVTNAGFSVASLQLTAHFQQQSVANDSHVAIDGNMFHFLNVAKQTLDGDKTLTVVDKNFTTNAQHRKYAKFTAMKCYETGMMGACCPGKDLNTPKRIYHVTL